MDDSRFKVENLVEGDEIGLTQCFYEAFTQSPFEQTKFFSRICADTPAMRRYYETSFAEQIRRGHGYSKKVMDTSSNNSIVAFSLWVRPDGNPLYWAAPAPNAEDPLRKEFAVALRAARQKYPRELRHWYLEILGVHPHYHGQGLGKRLMEDACALIDEGGEKSFVVASPTGLNLYAKYGFEVKGEESFPKPHGWYKGTYMIRPAKRIASSP